MERSLSLSNLSRIPKEAKALSKARRSLLLLDLTETQHLIFNHQHKCQLLLLVILMEDKEEVEEAATSQEELPEVEEAWEDLLQAWEAVLTENNAKLFMTLMLRIAMN